MSKLMELHARGAVIVCEHVAEMGYPILRGKRDEPISPISLKTPGGSSFVTVMHPKREL